MKIKPCPYCRSSARFAATSPKRRRFTETRLFGQLVALLAGALAGAVLVLGWYLVTR